MPPPAPQDDFAESPTQILQIMTSEVVRGGVLVSPLHDSLLRLSTKEKLYRGSKFVKDEAKSRDMKKYSSSTLAKRDSAQKLAIFNKGDLVREDGSRIDGGKAYAPSKDFSGAKFNNRQVEEPVFRDKPNEKSSTEKVGASRDGVSVKDGQNAVVCDFTNAVTPQVVCNEEDEDVIDDWVMCDRCQKWRLLPFGTKPEQLPEKWLCSMLNWLPGMNSCDISEEETTNARNALYCIPNSGRGDAQQLKKKRKVVADQFGLGTGTSKKFKANGDCSMDKHRSIEGRRMLTGCLNTARGKSMQKHNRNYLAAGAKYGAADKLLGGYTKTFSDCRSMESRLSDERGSSLKKQSMKESQDDQNFQTSTGSINGEEELNEWRRSLLPNNKRKLFSASNPDDNKPVKKGRVMFFNVSSNGDGFVDGTYKVQNLCKDQKSKFRNKAVSRQTRNLGYEKRRDGDVKNLSCEVRATSEVQNANLFSDEANSRKAKEDNAQKACFGNASITNAKAHKDRRTSSTYGQLKNGKANDPSSNHSRKKSNHDAVVAEIVKDAPKFSKNEENQNGKRSSEVQPSGDEKSVLSHLDNGVCGVNSSILAAKDVLEKAKELRAYANVLKSFGFDFESNDAYFQAALKFLQGASLLDTSKIENDKDRESIQIRVYSDTAKLCEHCGDEYEGQKEMALAALAYKCMEVAHMKLIYHSSSNKDRQELQVALETIPQGSYVISAQNRPSILRLLDFTQHVNLATEALKKSQNALVAANATTVEDAKKKDNLALVKRVINFSFHNVEEFTELVGQAMDATNNSGVVGHQG